MEPILFSLPETIHYANQQVRSRILNKKMAIDLPVSIYALDCGESISEEKTHLVKLIQVVDGTLEIECQQQQIFVQKEELIAIPANAPHKIYARERCKYLQIETKERKG